VPKRGERLPWRIEYAYPPSDRAPDGVKGVEVRRSLDEAAMVADDLATRGASGRIVNRDTCETLATFSAKPKDDDD
jgi:hypothetical protein